MLAIKLSLKCNQISEQELNFMFEPKKKKEFQKLIQLNIQCFNGIFNIQINLTISYIMLMQIKTSLKTQM